MNVMKRAWEIAKEGQMKFGGKVSEYFAVALKMAWAEVKGNQKVQSYEYTLPNRKGLWVAKIVGSHPIYKLERHFLREDDINEDNYRVFWLYNGIYDIKYSNKGRMFVKVENGNIEDISYDEVIQLATDMGVAA